MSPIFEFECKNCNKIFEDFVDNRDIQKVVCECGEDAIKILSAPNWNITGTCYNPLSPKKETSTKEKEGYTYRNGYYVKETLDKRILFTLYCDKCTYEIEDLCYADQEPDQKCPKCNTQLKKRTQAASFELKYDPKTDMCNWEGESSQYWKDVKEERRLGKNVKGLNEK